MRCCQISDPLVLFGWQTLSANFGQHLMIHIYGALIIPQMLYMATATTTDICVKSGGLCPQQGLIVGVADDTIVCLYTFDWRMTSSAVVLEESMTTRQRTGVCHALPGYFIK